MISECEKCEGTGAIAYEYAAHSLSESPSIGVDECPECDGEGYICRGCGGAASSEDDDRHIDCNDGDRERRDKGNAAGGTITLPGVDRFTP